MIRRTDSIGRLGGGLASVLALLAGCSAPPPPLFGPVTLDAVATGDGEAVGFHRMAGEQSHLFVVTEDTVVAFDAHGTETGRLAVMTAASSVAGTSLALSEAEGVRIYDANLSPTGVLITGPRCRGLFALDDGRLGCLGQDFFYLQGAVYDPATGSVSAPLYAPSPQIVGAVYDPTWVIPGRAAVLVGPLVWVRVEGPHTRSDMTSDLELPLTMVGSPGQTVLVAADGASFHIERCLEDGLHGPSCRDSIAPFVPMADATRLVAMGPSDAEHLVAIESPQMGGFCDGEGCRAMLLDASGRLLAHTQFVLPTNERLVELVHWSPEDDVVNVVTNDCSGGPCSWSLFQVPLQ